MRVTPSLPQRGRQPKGGIPLTPIFQGNIVNLNKDYHNRGMPEHLGQTNLKERFIVSLRVSDENRNNQI